MPEITERHDGMPEIRILKKRPHGRIVAAWPKSNYYGDTPSKTIIDFCGEAVINELERRPLRDKGTDYPKGTIVYFERNGIAYHIYKGINERPRMQEKGKYGYNVYRYTDEDAVSAALPRKRCSEAPHDLIVAGSNKSNNLKEDIKMPNYPIDTNNTQVFVDPTTNKSFTIVDDSYVESELPLIEAYNNSVNEKCRIHLDAMFEFGVQGGIDNGLLLVLNSNCGYGDVDSVAFRDPRIRAAFAKIRKDERRPYYALSKELRCVKQTDGKDKGKMFPMCGWWDGHIGKKKGLLALVKELKGGINEDEAIEWLSCHFAAREFYCYHSEKSNINAWLRVCKGQDSNFAPHQEVLIEEIRNAIKQEIPIFITRAKHQWFEFAKKHIKEDLENYKYLFIRKNQRCAYITSGNIRRINNDDSAWEEFKNVIETRFKKLSSN